MKQLDFDRAFPQTPDCIHAAIEMGFRKGQKQMKMKNKIITLSSIAAALMIMFAVTLATGGLSIAPKPDVLAQPEVTDMPKTTEEPMVWCTEKGNYYHSEEHCSGMEGAIYGTLSYALALDKGPCPVCIAVGEEPLLPTVVPAPEEYTPLDTKEENSEPTRTTVYTEYGKSQGYYHRLKNCGGKDYRREITEDQAIHENLQACLGCSFRFVYYTEKGKFYHSDAECSGMMNASAHPREDARRDGKLPCPTCLMVYANEDGLYFHLLSGCMGQDDEFHTLEEAYTMGNRRCPLCLSPATVYATKLGYYFHAVQDCSGMKGASATTPEAEWNNGKLPCPVCITSNAESFSELQSNPVEEINSMNLSAPSASNIDTNLSFLGTITQLDRLYQAAFGNLEEVLAAAYGFMPEIAENSWILSNGQQTILSLNFQNTGSDSALEAKWILNVSLNTDREISNHFMERIRNFPMTAMHRMAIDAAQNHMKDIHPRNAEALDPYVNAIRLGIDEEYQIKYCRIQFPCAMHALYVEFQPEEMEDGGWSWHEKTYTETT